MRESGSARVSALDLSDNNLDTLPDTVIAWTSLRSLDLNDNRLSALPDAVAAWTSLTALGRPQLPGVSRSRAVGRVDEDHPPAGQVEVAPGCGAAATHAPQPLRGTLPDQDARFGGWSGDHR
ncbi:leucine-rich repeat domain-containing protein [Micromonospora sp. ALFpr18c]|uniref:leucine-rich repeat domain-containing protein n=1 Tax=Micromonospora sp. ALFpr18c TaxID=1458665 RepID=UPI001CEDE050